MSLDDRARRAATDLLDRAAQHPVPSVHALVAPRRSTRGIRLAAAAAVVVLAGLGFLLVRDDASDVELTMPSGDAAKTWSPAGVGVSLAVPAAWEERGPRSGFSHSISGASGDGYVLTNRQRNVHRLDLAALASNRAADLQSYGATSITTDVAVLDGHDVVVLRYRIAPTSGSVGAVVVTEYDIPMGEWFALVAVGEREPADRSELTDWIASTIDIGSLGDADVAFGDALEHPAEPLPIPDGITATSWSPDGLGATIDVPTAWEDQALTSFFDPDGEPLVYDEYQFKAAPNGGGPALIAGRISSEAAAAREEQLARSGADVAVAADTTVDGHRARAIRYWQSRRGYPTQTALFVDYAIDLGGGAALLITTIENDGGEDHADLLAWIRSTVRIG